MGLRQSKRSVDISGSPKKDSQAAVLEKIPQTTDENTADKIEEVLIKAPINGDTKSAEVAELNKSVNEETKEVAVTDVANDVKSEEVTSPLKDEKKEKVKKKRSFRSFSFLRREKKNKEENNKNGEITKESKPDNVEQTEVAPVAVAEASTVEEPAAPVSVETGAEPTKENDSIVEEKEGVAVVDAPTEETSVKEEAAVPVEETPVANTEQETAQNVEVATESGGAVTEQEQVPATPETTADEVIADVSAVEEVAQPIVDAEPVQENEKQVEVTSEESQVVQTSEE